VLSHRTAAEAWDLLRATSGLIHVTVVGKRRPKRGIVVHQVRKLDPRDCTMREGISVTSLARTLLDVAETTTLLPRAWDAAERLRLLDVRAVEAVCERSPGRHGLKPLRAIAAEARHVSSTPSTALAPRSSGTASGTPSFRPQSSGSCG
jgi:hypothetical protein